eukprot:1883127-Rhodomonas_salina.2
MPSSLRTRKTGRAVSRNDAVYSRCPSIPNVFFPFPRVGAYQLSGLAPRYSCRKAWRPRGRARAVASHCGSQMLFGTRKLHRSLGPR